MLNKIDNLCLLKSNFVDIFTTTHTFSVFMTILKLTKWIPLSSKK